MVEKFIEILNAFFNNDRIPPTGILSVTILLIVVLSLYLIDFGTLLKEKFASDANLQLQYQTQQYESDMNALRTIADLNTSLNDRLQSVLDAYNQQTVVNEQLSVDNLKLNREVDQLKNQLEEKDASIEKLKNDNAILLSRIQALEKDNESLQSDIDILNKRINALFETIQKESQTNLDGLP